MASKGRRGGAGNGNGNGEGGEGARAHVLIVEARFYEPIADQLAAGAERRLKQRGATWTRVAVPGALEIPAAIVAGVDASEAIREGAIEGRAFDAYVALGCVIRGETTHYDIVCAETSRALMDIALQAGVPIGNGVLTVENEDQARRRADPDDLDKGGEAAAAALAVLALRRRLGVAD